MCPPNAFTAARGFVCRDLTMMDVDFPRTCFGDNYIPETEVIARRECPLPVPELCVF